VRQKATRTLSPIRGGGQESPYKPEFAEEAYILCAEQGATDLIFGRTLRVAEATIRKWRLKHVEFRAAIRAGKVETDDAVERATVQHITGYYVNTENPVGRLGKVVVREWVKGDANAGLKWLAARRPEVYREKKVTEHQVIVSEGLAAALEEMTERARERRRLKQLPVPLLKSETI
jgi:hypothetical protein